MKLTEQQRTALVKRLADFTEKASIASLAVGVFQSTICSELLSVLLLLFVP